VASEKILSAEELKRLAARYVWWLKPDEVLAQAPSRLLVQIISYATFDDAWAALEHFGRDAFAQALISAPAGALDPRSWNVWHLYLGLAKTQDEVPPMPVRRV
jgi:hypothetical protein